MERKSKGPEAVGAAAGAAAAKAAGLVGSAVAISAAGTTDGFSGTGIMS